MQANKDRLQAPATSSSLKVACGKKITSSVHQVDGGTYTFALQSGFTRLPRFTSNLDCQSETKERIRRISFGPAEARGLFGCRTGSGRLAQHMEIPFLPRLFIGARSFLQRRHCAPRRPSAPRTGATTPGEAKDVLDWHSRRAFKMFVSA